MDLPPTSRKDSRLVRTCKQEFAARAMRMAELSSIDHGQMFRLKPGWSADPRVPSEGMGRSESLEKLLASTK